MEVPISNAFPWFGLDTRSAGDVDGKYFALQPPTSSRAFPPAWTTHRDYDGFGPIEKTSPARRQERRYVGKVIYW